MKKLLILSVFIMGMSTATAGTSKGTITHLMVHVGDIVIFSAGPHIDKPACSTVRDHWALSLKTEKGKAMYAMLLSSAAQNLTVGVKGSNTCSAWGDRESPVYMYINY